MYTLIAVHRQGFSELKIPYEILWQIYRTDKVIAADAEELGAVVETGLIGFSRLRIIHGDVILVKATKDQILSFPSIRCHRDSLVYEVKHLCQTASPCI